MSIAYTYMYVYRCLLSIVCNNFTALEVHVTCQTKSMHMDTSQQCLLWGWFQVIFPSMYMYVPGVLDPSNTYMYTHTHTPPIHPSIPHLYIYPSFHFVLVKQHSTQHTHTHTPHTHTHTHTIHPPIHKFYYWWNSTAHNTTHIQTTQHKSKLSRGLDWIPAVSFATRPILGYIPRSILRMVCGILGVGLYRGGPCMHPVGWSSTPTCGLLVLEWLWPWLISAT